MNMKNSVLLVLFGNNLNHFSGLDDLMAMKLVNVLISYVVSLVSIRVDKLLLTHRTNARGTTDGVQQR